MIIIIGTKQIAFIYIISGIGGNLLSANISDVIGVGASTSFFGIIGAYLGFLVLNWKG